jgi:hypothetical protein
VGIIKFHKRLKRPTVAPTFGVEQKSHARFLIPIIIGALNGAKLQQSRRNAFSFNQAGRSGHLIFLAETPVISGWKEIDHVVLSKSKRLGADFNAWTAFTVKKASINKGLGGCTGTKGAENVL